MLNDSLREIAKKVLRDPELYLNERRKYSYATISIKHDIGTTSASAIVSVLNTNKKLVSELKDEIFRDDQVRKEIEEERREEHRRVQPEKEQEEQANVSTSRQTAKEKRQQLDEPSETEVAENIKNESPSMTQNRVNQADLVVVPSSTPAEDEKSRENEPANSMIKCKFCDDSLDQKLMEGHLQRMHAIFRLDLTPFGLSRKGKLSDGNETKTLICLLNQADKNAHTATINIRFHADQFFLLNELKLFHTYSEMVLKQDAKNVNRYFVIDNETRFSSSSIRGSMDLRDVFDKFKLLRLDQLVEADIGNELRRLDAQVIDVHPVAGDTETTKLTLRDSLSGHTISAFSPTRWNMKKGEILSFIGKLQLTKNEESVWLDIISVARLLPMRT